MERRILLSLFFVLLYGTVQAQTQPAVASVNGKPVYQAELVRRYANRPEKYKSITQKEYLQVLINTKLKVAEAERLHLDTTKSVKAEVLRASDRLAYPYLYDTIVLNNLVAEAYNRLQTDIEASQIFIAVPQWASPADTLAAWNKLLDTRKRILAGESFAKVASQISNDRDAATTGGYLGFFTVFKMLYPFENVAYNTPVGELSMPFRTQNGFHLIKVHSHRPSRGEVNVGVISMRIAKASASDSILNRINQAKAELLKGENYHNVYRKYSDFAKNPLISDETGWITAGRMSQVFDSISFALTESNSVSNPVANSYGWHLVKLLNKRPIGTLESRWANLLSKIEQNERRAEPRSAVLNRLKTLYKPVISNTAVSPLYTLKNSDLATADSVKINFPDSLQRNAQVLVVNNQKYTVEQFLPFVQKNGSKVASLPVKAAINTLYDQWVNETILEYEKDRLETKYPKYKQDKADAIEDIMATSVVNQEINLKAKADTAGLRAFYETNKHKYMWGTRIELFLVTGKDSNVMKAAYKHVYNIAHQNDSLKNIRADLALKFPAVTVQHMLLDTASVPSAKGTVALSELTNYPSEQAFSYTTGLVPPMPKTLEETHTEHLADFQAYLEKQWLLDLRKRYAIKEN
jgi:peptidyl-prolyl cis-trans isomerase SurA